MISIGERWRGQIETLSEGEGDAVDDDEFDLIVGSDIGMQMIYHRKELCLVMNSCHINPYKQTASALLDSKIILRYLELSE